MTAVDAVTARWRELRDFWLEYDGPGEAADAGGEPIDDLVHPRDLAMLRQWRDEGGIAREDLRNLEDFLLSRMPPHVAGARPAERAPRAGGASRRVLPQPFQGDAAASRVVLVASNPGYDQRMCSPREDVGEEICERDLAEAQRDQQRYRRILAGQTVEPPWVTEPPRGYHRQKICPGTAKPGHAVEWLLPIAAGFDRERYGRTLFCAGFVPYQSADADDLFMRAIRRQNDAGRWLPSQVALAELLASMIRDEDRRDRLVVFRKRETLEWIRAYLLGEGRCTLADLAERVTMIEPARAQRWQLNAGCLAYRVPALERLLA